MHYLPFENTSLQRYTIFFSLQNAKTGEINKKIHSCPLNLRKGCFLDLCN